MVSFANQKQARAKIVRQKMQQLRLRSQELEELVLIADQLLESRSVAQLINDEVIEMLENMLQLDKNAHYLEATLSSARNRVEGYLAEPQNRNVNRLVESDAQIAKCQRALTEMGKIVRRVHTKSRIGSEEMQSFIGELAWAHLVVGAISYIGQGYRRAMRGDFYNADEFYKRAKHALVQTPLPDPRRERMIKELGEMNSYRRAALSTDLMHETVEGFSLSDVTAKMEAYRNHEIEKLAAAIEPKPKQ